MSESASSSSTSKASTSSTSSKASTKTADENLLDDDSAFMVGMEVGYLGEVEEDQPDNTLPAKLAEAK